MLRKPYRKRIPNRKIIHSAPSKTPKKKPEDDNWSIVKKHPITKIVIYTGVTLGLLYLSSYLFDAAAKAAKSFGNLKQAMNSKSNV